VILSVILHIGEDLIHEIPISDGSAASGFWVPGCRFHGSTGKRSRTDGRFARSNFDGRGRTFAYFISGGVEGGEFWR
jgi:hypothetical protein